MYQTIGVKNINTYKIDAELNFKKIVIPFKKIKLRMLEFSKHET